MKNATQYDLEELESNVSLIDRLRESQSHWNKTYSKIYEWFREYAGVKESMDLTNAAMKASNNAKKCSHCKHRGHTIRHCPVYRFDLDQNLKEWSDNIAKSMREIEDNFYDLETRIRDLEDERKY